MLHIIHYFILITICRRHYYYLHFIDGETEAQRSYSSLPRVTQLVNGGSYLVAWLPSSYTKPLNHCCPGDLAGWHVCAHECVCAHLSSNSPALVVVSG